MLVPVVEVTAVDVTAEEAEPEEAEPELEVTGPIANTLVEE
jgi:hypothetical protein